MTKRKMFLECKHCKNSYDCEGVKSYYCSAECNFWFYVEKTESCWIWTAGGHKSGYGEFRFKGKFYRAHRYSYLIHKGEIPEGKIVCHDCDNPRCVNPNHIYAGSHAENGADNVDRDNVGSRKLSKNEVINIKALLSSGLNAHQISKLYNRSYCTIWNIKQGNTWKSVSHKIL